MSDLVQSPLQASPSAGLREFRRQIRMRPLLRKDVAANGATWLPLVMVLGAIAAVAYADHRVVSVSLVYLYILPLAVGAIFLTSIYNAVADFCGDDFNDDVTILVVKCNFDRSSTPGS